MALSAFDDKSGPPKDKDLEIVLGRSFAHWADLIAWLRVRFEPVTETWGFSGSKWGWALKVQHRKRTILYLTPQAKGFLVGFALGEKAVKAAMATDLADETLECIRSAPRYAEGRGVRLPVSNKRLREAVKKVAEAKMGLNTR